jgi:outer membrane lipoprotein SlyB
MVWQFESEIEKFALFAWHFQREFDEGDVPARIHAKTKLKVLNKNVSSLVRLTGLENMKFHKLHASVFAAAVSAVVLTGCVNPDGTQDNTAGGALIGAGAGALIGGANGRGGGGALVGAAIGAITGGLIGHSMDQDQQERLREQAPQTYVRVDQGQPLGVADVKALAQAKVSDDIIINQINNSHTVYHLSAADIIWLRDSGVSDKVINFMINTPASTGVTSEVAAQSTVVVAQPPPPPPVETVLVAPGPGYMWVDGEWVWNGGWIWSAGHWGYPPRPGVIWIGGSWSHGNDGWHREPGHWR